jgi:hypothetical protein
VQIFAANRDSRSTPKRATNDSGALAGILVRERAAPSCPIFKLASAEFDFDIWSIGGVLLRTEKIEVLF